MTARTPDGRRSGPAASTPTANAAAVPTPDTERAAKGSVQEAIGKLIGDDAVRARGTAEKKAATAAPPGKRPSPKASPPR